MLNNIFCLSVVICIYMRRTVLVFYISLFILRYVFVNTCFVYLNKGRNSQLLSSGSNPSVLRPSSVIAASTKIS